MNYITLGKRKDKMILFLHGWGGSIKSFYGAASNLSRYGFFCVLVDFPGHGESPEPKKGYSVFDYAKELNDVILSFGVKEVIIIAHSFGGRVAIKLCGNIKPNKYKIEKLVLVGSSGLKPRRGLFYKLKVKRYKKIKEKVNSGKLPESVLFKYGSEDYKCLSPIMKESFVKVVNEDLACDAKNIEVQTLLIFGKKDKDTPLYFGKTFKKLIEKSCLLVYNTGHYCYLSESERFIDDVYTFILKE